MEEKRAQKRHARPQPEPADVPFGMVVLVGIEGREFVLVAAAELNPLDDPIRTVVVPLGELPDAIERRRSLLGALTLR
jgi:hypothetical protein